MIVFFCKIALMEADKKMESTSERPAAASARLRQINGIWRHDAILLDPASGWLPVMPRWSIKFDR
ncbi:hypothetical protein LQ567_03975 [Niabella pedocola]|uniref:Uncharacterized protein n=1 Tax=Niabella pedocola TaxID=1752077 RepID=A0ABS8PLL7_9BACT|nr:hypothetical protein [Niabella pedocola]MCD2421906.1 hypothetical protein [Niabella pedocola]